MYRKIWFIAVFCCCSLVPNSNGQTQEFKILECFGNANTYRTIKVVRSFQHYSAYKYTTETDGLRLSRRARSFSCIYGFRLPIDENIHHLLFHINYVHLQRVRSEPPHKDKQVVSLRFFHSSNYSLRLNSINFASHNTGQRRSIYVPISRQIIGTGPLFMGLFRDSQLRWQEDLIFHLSLIITPIYLCPSVFMSRNEQQIIPSRFRTRKSRKLFRCSIWNEHHVDANEGNGSALATLSDVAAFCIDSSLVCDNSNNCPPLVRKIHADEVASMCPSVITQENRQSLLIFIIFIIPLVAVVIFGTAWLIRAKWMMICSNYVKPRMHGYSYDSELSTITPSELSSRSTPNNLLIVQGRHRAQQLQRQDHLIPPPTYQEVIECGTIHSSPNISLHRSINDEDIHAKGTPEFSMPLPLEFSNLPAEGKCDVLSAGEAEPPSYFQCLTEDLPEECTPTVASVSTTKRDE